MSAQWLITMRYSYTFGCLETYIKGQCVSMTSVIRGILIRLVVTMDLLWLLVYLCDVQGKGIF